MLSLIKRILTLWIFFSSSVWGSDAEIFEELRENKDSQRHSKILLEIGEAEEIPIQEGTRIQISRKGIVDAQLLPGKIRLVALKTGIVVLSLNKSEEEGQDFRYFISVNAKAEEILKNTDLSLLSKSAGLNFDPKTQLLQGESSKFRLFYKIKELCKDEKNCVFSARLSESSRLNLEESLSKSLGEGFEVQVRQNGSVLVLVSCNDKVSEKNQAKIVEHLVGDESLKRNLLVSCKKDWYRGFYTLFSKMIVMESNTAKDIGLQSKFEFEKSSTAFKSSLDLELDAAIKNKKAHLIGEPVLWLLSEVDARAQSGSEILVQKEKNFKSSKYTWKELGLDLKVKIFPLDKQKVRLQYSFLISNPSRDSGQIHRNKLESEIDLSIERPAVVGGIQFKSTETNTNSIPFLDSIPILGPIFRRTGESESESNIFLYFYLVRSETLDSKTKSVGEPVL